jgi:hypothetical protein
MAIVPNKDGMGVIANGFAGVVDPSYSTPNVFGTGVPSTLGYASELRSDTATGDVYVCHGGTRWSDARQW